MNLTYSPKWLKHITAALTIKVLTITVLPLTGCSKGIPIVSEVPEEKAYTLSESMIIAATERNRYQQIYTNQIWGVELPGGQTFETYLKDQVKEFLQEMKIMNLLAEQKEVIVTTSEKEQIRKLSEEYYDGLTADDIAYMGIKEEDVKTIYEAYFLANKVVRELTKDMNLEISDSEAKVITVEQIELSDSATAAEVLEKVSAEGSNFEMIAKEYSEDPIIRKQTGRGEFPGAYEEAAFALNAGEISPITAYNDKYYIIKCISDYDEDATQARKSILYTDRKKEAFSKIYDQFRTETPITFDNEDWDSMRFSKDDKTTTTNFFELYKKHFPE